MSSNQKAESSGYHEDSDKVKIKNPILEMSERITQLTLRLKDELAEKRELERKVRELEQKANRFSIVNETLLNRIDSLQREKKENNIVVNQEQTNLVFQKSQINANEMEDDEDDDFNMSPKSIDLNKKFDNSIEIKKEIQELIDNEGVESMIIYLKPKVKGFLKDLFQKENRERKGFSYQYIDSNVVICFGDINSIYFEHVNLNLYEVYKIIFHNVKNWQIAQDTSIANDLILESTDNTQISFCNNKNLKIKNEAKVELRKFHVKNHQNPEEDISIQISDKSYLLVYKCQFSHNISQKSLFQVKDAESKLEIISTKFEGNQTTYGSSGIVAQRRTQLIIHKCDFMDQGDFQKPFENSDCVISSHGHVTISDCHFQNNRCNSSRNCLIYFKSDGKSSIQNCTFKRCANLHFSDFSKVNIYNCHFEENGKETRPGGALVLTDNAEVELIKSSLRKNFTCGGGSICAVNQPKLTMSFCTIEENKCNDERLGRGGALLVMENSNVKILNCVFKNNISKSYGGAIAICDDTVLELCDCKFDSNKSDVRIGHSIYCFKGKSMKKERDNEFIGLHANEKWNIYYENKN